MELIVKDIGFAYQAARPLLKGVTFTVKSGQLLHLVGPNGCGKSTLIKILAGLIKPQRGQLSLNGNQPPASHYFAEMSYLPAEGNGLFDELSAYHNIRFWWSLRQAQPWTDAGCQELLTTWNLGGPYVSRFIPVGKYSTGMKRRLSLINLQLAHTKLWLLDEPLYGLDQASIVAFQQLLASHLAQGGAAVMISHDADALKGVGVTPIRLNLMPPHSKPPARKRQPLEAKDEI